MGKNVTGNLKAFGVKFAFWVKALGAGMRAGVRKNAGVLKARLKQFIGRRRRFRALRAAKVDTAKVVRIGGTASFTYGQYATGVPPSTLQIQRRAVAAAVAPASGPGGQNVDLALIMADGSDRGRADPAFDAHTQPICFWAMAIWNDWMPVAELQTMIWEAKTKLTLAAFPWQHVKGPAAATVATCARLEWEVKDACTMVTDEGRKLELDLEPPAVIKREVIEAVKRWRWSRVTVAFPQMELAGANIGGEMRPVWAALNFRKHRENWGRGKRRRLSQFFSNRQWPQARLFAAKFADTKLATPVWRNCAEKLS